MKKSISKYLPEIIKPLFRLLFYKKERAKFVRERKIRIVQDQLIRENYSQNTDKLILFIVNGADWNTGEDSISGGILSIASIYDESIKLREIHHSEVIMCTHSDAHLLLKHTQFPNEIIVYRFGQIFTYFKNLKSCIIHVPEFMLPKFLNHLDAQRRKIGVLNIHLNILNQNIGFMPEVSEVNRAKSLALKVTQTTAHENYTTKEMRDKYDIPLHKLSVFGSPERYKFKKFSEKENVLILSPDDHPLKEEIIRKLKEGLPNFEIRIIQNLKYNDYLSLVAKAKFTITFGEGLDFYLIETVFSGGVGFAVYNNEFFTAEFKLLEQIYSSFDELSNRIIDDIKELNTEEHYNEANSSLFKSISTQYKYNEYVENIKNFYKGDYTFQ